MAPTGPLGLPKALATRTEELGDGVGTKDKSKLSVFSKGPSDPEQARIAHFRDQGTWSAFTFKSLPELFGLEEGLAMKLVKLYFSSEESDGLSLNTSLSMHKREH